MENNTGKDEDSIQTTEQYNAGENIIKQVIYLLAFQGHKDFYHPAVLTLVAVCEQEFQLRKQESVWNNSSLDWLQSFQ